MPQATDELRAKMEERFGDPLCDGGPYDFLIERGWKCNRGVWGNTMMPDINHVPQDEWDCILYLIQEWDHGISMVFKSQKVVE